MPENVGYGNLNDLILRKLVEQQREAQALALQKQREESEAQQGGFSPVDKSAENRANPFQDTEFEGAPPTAEPTQSFLASSDPVKQALGAVNSGIFQGLSSSSKSGFKKAQLLKLLGPGGVGTTLADLDARRNAARGGGGPSSGVAGSLQAPNINPGRDIVGQENKALASLQRELQKLNLQNQVQGARDSKGLEGLEAQQTKNQAIFNDDRRDMIRALFQALVGR